jgi:DNA-binding CsgD family transcriptional regulator
MRVNSSALTAERVRGDVEVLSRAGLDLEEFLSEAVASVSRAVPWVAACIGTHDPATHMLTSARKYGDLDGRNEVDFEFGQLEYDSGEPTSYPLLAASAVDALAMQLQTSGDVERSERMSRLMVPTFGYWDELRVVFREHGRFWGGMALFRGGDDPAFSAAEVEFLGGLGTAFARGVRGGLLAACAVAPGAVPAGPAVVIVGSDDTILQSSPAATARLQEMVVAAHGGDPFATIAGLVGAARRVARGETDAVPSARVRTVAGTWLVLHASPLSGVSSGRVGEVVVTIEEARPPEIVALVVAAFDLTPRERDVTQLVLQGVDTKEIAATLHLSAYTVQDHLKSVFDKADVRSRRELIARVYFDQYVPRMGSELGPSGWFAG